MPPSGTAGEDGCMLPQPLLLAQNHHDQRLAPQYAGLSVFQPPARKYGGKVPHHLNVMAVAGVYIRNQPDLRNQAPQRLTRLKLDRRVRQGRRQIGHLRAIARTMLPFGEESLRCKLSYSKCKMTSSEAWPDQLAIFFHFSGVT